MTSTYAIRKATAADLQSIIAIHEAAFGGFFLTLLGRRFLMEMYRAFVVEGDGICRVIELKVAQGKAHIVGFVAGAYRPKLFFRHLLLSRGLRFALAAVPGLIRSPLTVFPRLLSAVFYRGEKPPAVENAALLSSLGVHPKEARLGLGRRLVDSFCDDAIGRGAHAVYLTTDRHENDAVNVFYERAGFQLLTAQRRRNGRIMNVYIRTLVPGSSS